MNHALTVLAAAECEQPGCLRVLLSGALHLLRGAAPPGVITVAKPWRPGQIRDLLSVERQA